MHVAKPILNDPAAKDPPVKSECDIGFVGDEFTGDERGSDPRIPYDPRILVRRPLLESEPPVRRPPCSDVPVRTPTFVLLNRHALP